MKSFEISITALIVLILLTVFNPPIWLIIFVVFVLGLILIHDDYRCAKRDSKVYTNKEIANLGELIRVESSCTHTITYLFVYKNNRYLLTYVGDLSLSEPDKEAVKL